MVNKLYIFGENHARLDEIESINQQIRNIKPNYLLHELLYDDQCLTVAEMAERLKNCEVGNVCDPNLNKDIYQLGMQMRIPIIGIDLKSLDRNLSIAKQFELRERNMVHLIEKYRSKGTVVVVVGDAHLRTEVSRELGPPSPIPKIFSSANIVRSPTAEYSAETKIPDYLKW